MVSLPILTAFMSCVPLGKLLNLSDSYFLFSCKYCRGDFLPDKVMGEVKGVNDPVWKPSSTCLDSVNACFFFSLTPPLHPQFSHLLPCLLYLPTLMEETDKNKAEKWLRLPVGLV